MGYSDVVERQLAVLIRVSLLGCAVVLGLVSLMPNARGEEPSDSKKNNPVVSQAATAFQLAIEGQRTKSPVLMLAAIELIGGLKTSERALRQENDSVLLKNSKEGTLSLDPVDWQEKAMEYSAGDKTTLAFVEARVEKLSSRQLISYPTTAYKENFGNATFAVLDRGILQPGQNATYANIPVVGGKIATLGAVGDPDADIEFVITDGRRPIRIESFRGIALMTWVPGVGQRIGVQITNRGSSETECVFISD